MLIMIPQLLSNIGLAWLAWYLYKFIIKPRLSPEEPRELPYLIPCKFLEYEKSVKLITMTVIGHVIPMFTASHKLFTKGR
jgi:cholesterol 7alpha-monooxygenase